MTGYLGVEAQYLLGATVAFSGVFALGVIFSILGSIKLQLAETLQIDDAKVGTLISSMMFSCLIAVLIIGPLTDKVGYKAVALTGFVLGAFCVWLLASARSYKVALLASLLLGIAAMCVNTVGNTLGPTILFGGADAARASNLLNVFFGVGAFITPLILAYLLGFLGYKKTVGLIGVVLIIPVLYSFYASFPQPDSGFEFKQVLALLSSLPVLVSGFTLFFYVALESTMAGFVTTYMKSHQLSDKASNTVLSTFWISLMAARLLTAIFLSGKIDPAMLIPMLGVLAVIGIGMMVAAPSAKIGVLGTIISGFAFGPIFPTLVGVAFGKTDAINAGTAGTVFGLVFAIGLLGGTIVPAQIGKYTAKKSIRDGLKIALGVAVCLVVVSLVLWLAIPAVHAENGSEAAPAAAPEAVVQDVVIEPPAVVVEEAAAVEEAAVEEAVEADEAAAAEEAAKKAAEKAAARAAASIGAFAGEAAEAAGVVVEEALEDADEAVSEVVDAPAEAVGDAVDAVEEAVDDAVETAEDAVDDAVEAVEDAVS